MQQDDKTLSAHKRPIPPVQMAAMLICAAAGLAGAWALDSDATGLAPPNAAAPPASLRLCAAVALWSVLSFWLGLATLRQRQARRANREIGSRVPLRRPAKDAGATYLFIQAFLATFLFAMCSDRQWTYHSVGLDADWPIVISLLAGVTAYVAFVVVLTALLALIGLLEKTADGNLTSLAMIWPRGRKQKLLAGLAFCGFNPVIEELMFRGILVHQFAVATNSWTMPLIVGLIANLANHAYQGRAGLATHIPFFLITAGLTVSPAGLWGAIGLHFAGDVIPIATMRTQLRAYRRRHRLRELGQQDQWRDPETKLQQ